MKNIGFFDYNLFVKKFLSYKEFWKLNEKFKDLQTSFTLLEKNYNPSLIVSLPADYLELRV